MILSILKLTDKDSNVYLVSNLPYIDTTTPLGTTYKLLSGPSIRSRCPGRTPGLTGGIAQTSLTTRTATICNKRLPPNNTRQADALLDGSFDGQPFTYYQCEILDDSDIPPDLDSSSWDVITGIVRTIEPVGDEVRIQVKTNIDELDNNLNIPRWQGMNNGCLNLTKSSSDSVIWTQGSTGEGVIKPTLAGPWFYEIVGIKWTSPLTAHQDLLRWGSGSVGLILIINAAGTSGAMRVRTNGMSATTTTTDNGVVVADELLHTISFGYDPDADLLLIYYDGVLVKSRTITGSLTDNTTLDFEIGFGNTDVETIGEFRVFDNIPSPEQVASWWDRRAPMTLPGIVEIYNSFTDTPSDRWDAASGTSANDSDSSVGTPTPVFGLSGADGSQGKTHPVAIGEVKQTKPVVVDSGSNVVEVRQEVLVAGETQLTVKGDLLTITTHYDINDPADGYVEIHTFPSAAADIEEGVRIDHGGEVQLVDIFRWLLFNNSTNIGLLESTREHSTFVEGPPITAPGAFYLEPKEQGHNAMGTLKLLSIGTGCIIHFIGSAADAQLLRAPFPPFATTDPDVVVVREGAEAQRGTSTNPLEQGWAFLPHKSANVRWGINWAPTPSDEIDHTLGKADGVDTEFMTVAERVAQALVDQAFLDDYPNAEDGELIEGYYVDELDAYKEALMVLLLTDYARHGVRYFSINLQTQVPKSVDGGSVFTLGRPVLLRAPSVDSANDILARVVEFNFGNNDWGDLLLMEQSQRVLVPTSIESESGFSGVVVDDVDNSPYRPGTSYAESTSDGGIILHVGYDDPGNLDTTKQVMMVVGFDAIDEQVELNQIKVLEDGSQVLASFYPIELSGNFLANGIAGAHLPAGEFGLAGFVFKPTVVSGWDDGEIRLDFIVDSGGTCRVYGIWIVYTPQ